MPRVLYTLSAALVAVGCVVVGGCGWEEEAPVSASDVVGTYVLDERPEQDAEPYALSPRHLCALYLPWYRDLAVNIKRGHEEIGITIHPDGTRTWWENALGMVERSDATWTRRDAGGVVMNDRSSWLSVAHHDGETLTGRDGFAHTTLVLNRLPVEPAR